MIRYVLFDLLISLAGEKVCLVWFWNHFFRPVKIGRVRHFVQPWSSVRSHDIYLREISQ